MKELSEWLSLMLAEISRKQDDIVRGQNESRARAATDPPPTQAPAAGEAPRQ